MRKRKVTITIETESMVLVRRRSNNERAWCEGCGAVSEFASLAVTETLIQANTDTVVELMRMEQLHAMKVGEQAPVICLTSILNQISKAV